MPVPAELVAGLTDALTHLPEAGGLAGELAERGTVTAESDVLHELVVVAIDGAGEAVAAACNGLLRGELAAAEVRRSAQALAGLLDLLDLVARRPARAG